ncbi:MAG: MATE family efflux transporter [Lachnospiraceae bacterium]|nr:MATE family efflux transporter [Lachnospiraceae bacterium]
MNENTEELKDDYIPLRDGKVSSLLTKFAVPSIVAMLVGSIYNIVDQYFIGQCVGVSGNAATNIAFPLAMCCTAIALLAGIGGASNFNLSMGRGHKDIAGYYIGNAIIMLAVLGTILGVGTKIYLDRILYAFGSPEDVLPYARTYVGITSIGFPYLILTIGGGHLIRADGSPRTAMACNLSGAVINTVLDYIFVMKLGFGMAGAAWATVIGQIVSTVIVIIYIMHFKTVKLEAKHFKPNFGYMARISSIGAASFVNQLAMMLVQVVMNNSLKYYGALSKYGAGDPIAASGIIIKTFQLFFAVVIGLSQGSQPIISYNYGAGNYRRVKETYLRSIAVGAAVTIFAEILFQTIPGRLLGIFGEGSPGYFEFGIRYFRIYLMLMFINFLQPISSTFFTSIGKPVKGIFLSLTRQIIYLLPALVILPRFFGIDGILYCGPVADALSFITVIIMLVIEFKNMK